MIELENLDCLSPTELRAYAERHGKAMGPGMRVRRQLARYASMKALAMEHRLNGTIRAAIAYEETCQMIYHRLPQSARW